MPSFAQAPGRLPPGRRIYAVGDVHGCADRLAALHRLIVADMADRPAEATLVHLGDYVDRGPDSRGVVARLAAGPPVPGMPVVNLLGNHEEMMLQALTGAKEAARMWLGNGGDKTLDSYDLAPDTEPAEWWAMLDPAHLEWLEGLSLSHTEGDYLFVHAGVRPGVPLPRQSRHDLLWIRDPFLKSDAAFGAVVVHGHTPEPAPVIRPNRIGLDTGAVLDGKLTAAVLENDRIGFLQV